LGHGYLEEPGLHELLHHPALLVRPEGIPDAYTALSLSVYSFSATLGAFLGGTLSDRLGRKAVLVGTLSFGLPLYLGLLFLPPENPLYLLLLAVTGALMNAGIPVAVVMAQELAPGHTATVSGLLMASPGASPASFTLLSATS
jgi:FSR family fosmidomycin resistance protein-like MFS transporter